jgi:hypothetical protein
MLLAIDRSGQMRAPTRTGERGTCPGCGARVDSAVGDLVIPHWRHFAQSDCDSWSGGETDWHLQWKKDAIAAGWSVEVPFIGPPLHRADAVSSRGHVIEFQHSGLNPYDLEERSMFYARFGPLTWVFDGAVSAWQRRWHKWRKNGASEEAIGVLAIEEPGRVWVLDPSTGRPFTTTRAGVLGSRVQVASMRWWSSDTACVTCGAMPTHAYPDGSPGYRFCLHDPIYESETFA